jgi:hypothetical protein
MRWIMIGHVKNATKRLITVNYEQRIEEATWSGN